MRLAKVTTTRLVKKHVWIGAGATGRGVEPAQQVWRLGLNMRLAKVTTTRLVKKKTIVRVIAPAQQSVAPAQQSVAPAQHSIERALVTTTVPAKKKILAGC